MATTAHRGIVRFRQALPHPFTPPWELITKVQLGGVVTVGVERIDGRTAVGDSSRRWQHRIVDGVVLTGTRS